MTGFIDVLEPHTAKLLFRFDPIRDIIEVQRRGVKTVVDLTKYRATEERQHEQQEDKRQMWKFGTYTESK